MNIYLAGKINRENDWREELIPDIRYDVTSRDDYPVWKSKKGVLWGNDYAGPYFIRVTKNALSWEKYGESHKIPLTNHKTGMPEFDGVLDYIRDECMGSIAKSDAVFAYINSTDCYGTLLELGYAYAMGKLIGIVFDVDPEVDTDLWFARSLATWDEEIRVCRYGDDIQDYLKGFIIDCGGEIQENYFGGYSSYAEYLQSDYWKQFAHEAKERVGNRCQLCNADGELHTHHRTYERLGEELPKDVVVLCANCHAKFHDKVR